MENIEYLLTNDEFMDDIQSLFDFDINKLPKSILVKIAKSVESNSIDIENILADAIEEGILDVKTYMSFGNVEFGSHGLTVDETQAFIDGLIGIALKQQAKLESVVSMICKAMVSTFNHSINTSLDWTYHIASKNLKQLIANEESFIRDLNKEMIQVETDLYHCKFYQILQRNSYKHSISLLNIQLQLHERHLSRLYEDYNQLQKLRKSNRVKAKQSELDFHTDIKSTYNKHCLKGGADK